MSSPLNTLFSNLKTFFPISRYWLSWYTGKYVNLIKKICCYMHYIYIFYYFFFITSFTLYPAHNRIGRGKLLLRHSVPHYFITIFKSFYVESCDTLFESFQGTSNKVLYLQSSLKHNIFIFLRYFPNKGNCRSKC